MLIVYGILLSIILILLCYIYIIQYNKNIKDNLIVQNLEINKLRNDIKNFNYEIESVKDRLDDIEGYHIIQKSDINKLYELLIK